MVGLPARERFAQPRPKGTRLQWAQSAKFLRKLEQRAMSYTSQYLQSELAPGGLEVSVLVNCMIQDAIRLGASDLHVEPWENTIAVRARALTAY